MLMTRLGEVSSRGDAQMLNILAKMMPGDYSAPHIFSNLFKEQPIYEQSAVRTLREQQENRPSAWMRQPLKIEQSHITSNSLDRGCDELVREGVLAAFER
jgi:hypothetical protein